VAVEGNILRKEYASFVGRFPIPMRHGLTVGEIASLFNSKVITGSGEFTEESGDGEKGSVTVEGCDLTIIPMRGWNRRMLFADTHLPWIAPSPNLPTPSSALVYPGQVIWEGTNISEGRGTTQPFEIFGAPFIDTDKILHAVATNSSDRELLSDRAISRGTGIANLPGAVLRKIAFEPTSGKWHGQVCHGFQIHVVDPELFKPYKSSLLLLQQIIKYHSDEFKWKEPPYEYEYLKLPIDLILGDKALRASIESCESMDSVESSWQSELDKFKQMSREFYLYG